MNRFYQDVKTGPYDCPIWHERLDTFGIYKAERMNTTGVNTKEPSSNVAGNHDLFDGGRFQNKTPVRTELRCNIKLDHI